MLNFQVEQQDNLNSVFLLNIVCWALSIEHLYFSF